MNRIALLILLFSINVNAQWRTESGNNRFDGDYKATYVIGKGNDYPYNKPKLVINKFEHEPFNMYISGMGYTGCDRNALEFVFDDEKEFYIAKSPNTNTDRDALFFFEFADISTYGFIKKLMESRKVYVRFSSKCNLNDMEFSLSGSTKTIKYVIGTWIKDNEAVEKELMADYDRIAEYYKQLGCEDLLDTITVMHTDYVNKDGNLFKTKEGTMTALKGAIVKYYNSNNSKYNFKINYVRGAYETDFHVTRSMAEYFTQDKRVIGIMDRGMKDFRKMADECE